MNRINYVYIIRCEDNSLYTGYTNDLEQRMKKHWEHKGAKYTKSRKPIKVEMTWKCDEASGARKLEYAIKNHLNKDKKEKLIRNPDMVSILFGHLKEFDYIPEIYHYYAENDG